VLEKERDLAVKKTICQTCWKTSVHTYYTIEEFLKSKLFDEIILTIRNEDFDTVNKFFR